MTEDEIRAALMEELVRVAPDLDRGGDRRDDHLQEDLEIDSMDFLNLVSALHARLGVAVPEADYPRLATLRLATGYLRSGSAGIMRVEGAGVKVGRLSLRTAIRDAGRIVRCGRQILGFAFGLVIGLGAAACGGARGGGRGAA
jgi:acyl carrier protein